MTTWNAGATALYGYGPDEMIRRNISELIPSDRPGELRSLLDWLAWGERGKNFETKRVRKDGTVIDVSMTISGAASSSPTNRWSPKSLITVPQSNCCGRFRLPCLGLVLA